MDPIKCRLPNRKFRWYQRFHLFESSWSSGPEQGWKNRLFVVFCSVFCPNLLIRFLFCSEHMWSSQNMFRVLSSQLLKRAYCIKDRPKTEESHVSKKKSNFKVKCLTKILNSMWKEFDFFWSFVFGRIIC